MNKKDGSLTKIRSTIIDIAKYGFRMPFVWYVNSKNIDVIPDLIDEAMQLNCYAGFSLPSIAESLFHKNERPPQYESYLRLLATVHKKYPYYDELLYPLNVIQRRCFTNPIRDFDLVYEITALQKKHERVSHCLYEGRLINFWVKVFLWQRWTVLNTYSGLENGLSLQDNNSSPSDRVLRRQ